MQYEAYKEAPAAYILCSQDKAIPIEGQVGLSV